MLDQFPGVQFENLQVTLQSHCIWIHSSLDRPKCFFLYCRPALVFSVAGAYVMLSASVSSPNVMQMGSIGSAFIIELLEHTFLKLLLLLNLITPYLQYLLMLNLFSWEGLLLSVEKCWEIYWPWISSFYTKNTHSAFTVFRKNRIGLHPGGHAWYVPKGFSPPPPLQFCLKLFWITLQTIMSWPNNSWLSLFLLSNYMRPSCIELTQTHIVLWM